LDVRRPPERANAGIRVLSVRAFIRVAVEIGMANGISDR
jgi:hypothetical protein